MFPRASQLPCVKLKTMDAAAIDHLAFESIDGGNNAAESIIETALPGFIH